MNQQSLIRSIQSGRAPGLVTMAVGACVFLLTCTAESSAEEKYAIVVGVNECPKFRFPDGSKPRPLRGAEADADAVADMLIRRYGFPDRNVLLLKGAQATREGVQRAFIQVARKSRADDVFVFHFSGHGTQVPDRQPFDEPDGLDEALCMWDTTERGENLVV